jgi:DNA mismatch repair protein MutS
MIEELARLGAKTLFATHYHQLNVLAETIPSIENYRVAVQEIGDQVVWSHRVLKGGTDRSYGIHVAKSAGMPSRVIARSEEILNELESDPQRPTTIAPPSQRIQLSLFEAEEPEIVKELRKLDVYALTPMQAMQLLDYWKTKL